MEPQLQYDPRTKQNIKENLYAFIYTPAMDQFQTRINNLIIRNCLLGGLGHKSFTYKGTTYSCDTTSPPLKRNRVIPQLVPDMEAYLRDLKELNEREMPYVLGYINQVLNTSNNLQDYLSLLPAAVHRPVEMLFSSCPCKSKALSNEAVQDIQKKNQHAIDLIKRRLVINLVT